MSGEQQLVDDYIEQDQNSRLLKYGAAFAGTTAMALAEMTFENNPAFAQLSGLTATCNPNTGHVRYHAGVVNTTGTRTIDTIVTGIGIPAPGFINNDIAPNRSFTLSVSDTGQSAVHSSLIYTEKDSNTGEVLVDQRPYPINLDCSDAAPKPPTTKKPAPAPVVIPPPPPATVAPTRSAIPAPTSPKTTITTHRSEPAPTVVKSPNSVAAPEQSVTTPNVPETARTSVPAANSTEVSTTTATTETTFSSIPESSTTFVAAVNPESSSPTTEKPAALIISQSEKPSSHDSLSGKETIGILAGTGLILALATAGGIKGWRIYLAGKRRKDDDGEQGHAGPAPAIS